MGMCTVRDSPCSSGRPQLVPDAKFCKRLKNMNDPALWHRWAAGAGRGAAPAACRRGMAALGTWQWLYGRGDSDIDSRALIKACRRPLYSYTIRPLTRGRPPCCTEAAGGNDRGRRAAILAQKIPRAARGRCRCMAAHRALSFGNQSCVSY